MPNGTLYLSDELAAQILQAAARAHPAECCGLIEGVETPDGWQALAIHQAANLSPEPKRRFLIDPQVQFDLMRRLRGSEHGIIGCFHSHPSGEAEPSATDRAEAYESGFLYLITAGDAELGFTLKAYLFEEESGFAPIEIARGE
jgi:proteasome lid subunit RPN8/RPN11